MQRHSGLPPFTGTLSAEDNCLSWSCGALQASCINVYDHHHENTRTAQTFNLALSFHSLMQHKKTIILGVAAILSLVIFPIWIMPWLFVETAGEKDAADAAVEVAKSYVESKEFIETFNNIEIESVNAYVSLGRMLLIVYIDQQEGEEWDESKNIEATLRATVAPNVDMPLKVEVREKK
jgi:hypothetical protein